jgi:hypothetical protein
MEWALEDQKIQLGERVLHQNYLSGKNLNVYSGRAASSVFPSKGYSLATLLYLKKVFALQNKWFISRVLSLFIQKAIMNTKSFFARTMEWALEDPYFQHGELPWLSWSRPLSGNSFVWKNKLKSP